MSICEILYCYKKYILSIDIIIYTFVLHVLSILLRISFFLRCRLKITELCTRKLTSLCRFSSLRMKSLLFAWELRLDRHFDTFYVLMCVENTRRLSQVSKRQLGELLWYVYFFCFKIFRSHSEKVIRLRLEEIQGDYIKNELFVFYE